MSPLWINLTKVGFVAALYLFLWYVARSVAAHLSTSPTTRSRRDEPADPASVTIAITGSTATPARHVEVRGPLVVGRGEVDVVVDDPFASDRHLMLDLAGGRLIVHDLGSTNGTLVNDVVIHEPMVLDRGDTIRVGTTILEVR
jgi:hypothetical protein